MAKMHGDQRRLIQVLINLVKNALQYTINGSIDIAVCYDNPSETLHVCVRDTGIGVKPEELPNLFKKFGKKFRTAELNSTGNGMGLLIVQ